MSSSLLEPSKKTRGSDVGERLSRRADHLERERAVILNHAAKEKHFYNKSLQDLKTTKTSSLVGIGASSSSFPSQLDAVAAGANSNGGRPSSKARPFSRHLIKGEPERLQRKIVRAASPSPGPSSIPRRLAPLVDGGVNPSHSLLPPLQSDNIRRSSSERQLTTKWSPETFRSKTPSFRRKVVAANGNVKAIIDLLPSLKRDDSDPFGGGGGGGGGGDVNKKKSDDQKKDFGDDHGMSNRLSKAVKEIETELAAHGMTLDDVSIKPDIPERPMNLELPDKTKKYHTFSSLPQQIPIPWHLYGTVDDEDDEDDDDDDDDDIDGGLTIKVPSSRQPSAKSRQPSAKPRKKSAFRRDNIPINKTLEQEFKELKNCRYLRKYKPNTKRESWF